LAKLYLQNPVSKQTVGNAPEKGPSLPQHLIGQGETGRKADDAAGSVANVALNAVHDESLKNLLMSWYYAGYYTGLYEGQQQGAAGRQA
jgi:hypothetical protein